MNGCFLLVLFPFLIPIVLVILFFTKIFFKGRNEAWKGVVIDKSHNTRLDSDRRCDEHFYCLQIRMTDGRVRNVAVSSKFWNSCAIGDTVEKQKGSLSPRKAMK